jgi:putative hydrolase of the HAD superfamily
MIDAGRIRGILFDYGGTIDSNGVHWAEVIWQAYQAENVPITKEAFREAYVYGERTLGKNPIIQPIHTFLDMMRLKIKIQIEWLSLNGGNRENRENGGSRRNQRFSQSYGTTVLRSYGLTVSRSRKAIEEAIATYCYDYARTSIQKARPVIEWIAGKYPIVMVSNFYGNMRTVLRDFGMDHLFPVIIESAVVGVRKPDPQLFRLGVDALQLEVGEVVVIGDSYDKDIVPATTVGCQTIWLKNAGWTDYTGNETADLIISDFAELREWL